MSEDDSRAFHRALLKKVREVLYGILEDEFGEKISYDAEHTAIVIEDVSVEEVEEAFRKPSWRKNLWH